MKQQLIECVPNISEGRDLKKINTIANVVTEVEGVKLLDIDPGKATNRTVITFVGEPSQVIEAAFKLIKKASELIDMSKQTGEHPRFGIQMHLQQFKMQYQDKIKNYLKQQK